MISISNGLLPDFSEQEDNKPSALISFSYDNTLDEIDGAMQSFQKRFSGKRGLLIVFAYALFSLAAVAAIIANPTSIVSYLVLALCVGSIFYSLTDKKRRRKKIIEALKDMDPEEYRASIFEDRIELETVIKQKQNQVDLKIDEEADEKIISPLKSVFVFGNDLLNFEENEESLLLIFNRQQIYCFPKRCLSAEQEEQTRNFLTEKLENRGFEADL